MPADHLNWEDGTWRAENKSAAEAEVIISADWAPIRDFDPVISENPEAVYGDLLQEMRNADLRITNLECPLSDRGEAVAKSGSVFKGMNRHVKGLTAIPIEVATMANNHVFDFGLDAFNDTRNLLAENKIDSLGAGLSLNEAEKPLVKKINGVKIGLINFSEGEDLTAAGKGPGVFGWEVERVCQLTTELKQEVDAVIVICHAGLEYIPFPPPYITEAFQSIADAGADLVTGHHPHVPQGVQIYNGVPICYSLGNFVFFQKTNLHYRKLGYMVKAGISKEGISGIRLIPYEILPERLALLKDSKLTEFYGDMQKISGPLNETTGITDTWNGFLKYYGLDGFKDEISRIMKQIDDDLPKGVTMFRNRITTMQHSYHLTDLMTRLAEGTLQDAPDWAVDMADLWFSKTI